MTEMRASWNGMVRWFREGQPAGAPRHGYIPLLALLPRRLTDEEADLVVRRVLERGGRPVATADLQVMMTRLMDALPSPSDLGRVLGRLQRADVQVLP